MRHRAARRPHVPNPNRPDHRPERGRKLADNTNRDGGAERVADPAGQKSIAVALALRGHDAARSMTC